MSTQMSNNAFSAAVTGIGMVTAAGLNAAETWQRVLDGVPGNVGPIPQLAGLPYDFGYTVPRGLDVDALLGRSLARAMGRFAQLAVVAAREALADAALDRDSDSDAWDASRVAVVIGSSHGGLDIYDDATRMMRERGDRRVSPMVTPLSLLNHAASSVCLATGARGPSMGMAASCASGTSAIGHARLLLRAGLCDIAIAGGAESMHSRTLIASAIRAGTVSTHRHDPAAACRPFGADRDGMVMGEGAGVLVLEHPDHARARGARVLAHVSGYGSANDAHSPAAPHPEGVGLEHALRTALAEAGMAGVAPGHIGHVNAHGTGTVANDAIEAAVLHRVLGAGPLVTSTKAVTGHTLGAAGAIETALTVLALRDQVVPPTANLDAQDPEIRVSLQAKQARPMPLAAAVKTSLGFGGHNAALVLTRAQSGG
jgi:3-oxoacyl-[acyl-carrier-protein] synthase II